jgi:hypothetical protein
MERESIGDAPAIRVPETPAASETPAVPQTGLAEAPVVPELPETRPETPSADASPVDPAGATPTTPDLPAALTMPGATAGNPSMSVTKEELAAMAATVEAARPLTRPVALPTAESEAGVATADAAKHRRRARATGVIARLAMVLLTIGLFAAGAAIGVAAYERMQPPAPVVGDAQTGGVATPNVVKELTAALASNDADALRSAVSGDPYRLLAGELQSWNMQGVTSVETLATMQDGPRTATEIIINGRTESGTPIIFNLVVHVANNQIVTFR